MGGIEIGEDTEFVGGDQSRQAQTTFSTAFLQVPGMRDIHTGHGYGK